MSQMTFPERIRNDPDKRKYVNLEEHIAIEQASMIESDDSLTVEEKIQEFHRIGYGQVCDKIGDFYYLAHSTDWPSVDLILPTVTRILYFPKDSALPYIVLFYRPGLERCLPAIQCNYPLNGENDNSQAARTGTPRCVRRNSY